MQTINSSTPLPLLKTSFCRDSTGKFLGYTYYFECVPGHVCRYYKHEPEEHNCIYLDEEENSCHCEDAIKESMGPIEEAFLEAFNFNIF